MNKLTIVSLGLALLLVAALLGGCGGDDPAFVERPSDSISGHWVLVEEAPAAAGARTEATAASDISIMYTAGGLPRWSGNLRCHEGLPFDPNQGTWSKAGETYTVRNSAGQTLEFIWVGSQLRSTTLGPAETPTSAAPVTQTPMYQWWART